MEIITGVERRRSWPLERKLAVLEEVSRGSESAASVARRHDIRPQQLYRWRRELREGRLDGNEQPSTFLPVTLANHEGPNAEPTPAAPRRAERRRATTRSRVEIELANGRLLRVDAGIEPETTDATDVAATARGRNAVPWPRPAVAPAGSPARS